MRQRLTFHGAQVSGWFWFWLLAAVLACVLVFLLLRYERKLVSRPVGISLLSLRLAVLLLFFLTMLQPVLERTFDSDREGRIVVAIDVSQSMDTSDTHALDVEKLRWSRALNMLGYKDDQLDGWEQAFASNQEPQWVNDSETRDPDRIAELTTVRRDSLKKVFADLDQRSRRELALRLLTETELLERLQQVAPVEVVLFAGESDETDSETIINGLETVPVSLKTDATSLGSALSAPATIADDDEDVLGIVLLSDGRDNAAVDPVNAARQLDVAGTPVYSIVVGSVNRPKDLSIGDLDYPQSTFKDDRAVLSAAVRTAGFEGKNVMLTLEKDGTKYDSRTVVPDGPETRVEFQLDAAELGRHGYTLRIEPQKIETRVDNNEQSFAMKVVDDTVDVLILEGEPRWEFRFLHNAYERDERVNVRSVVFTQPYLNLLDDTTFPRQIRLPKDEDLKESPFAEADLIIVGDVSEQNLPPNFWPLLEKYVAESGGTLVLAAGKTAFPHRHRSEILRQLLPVTRLNAVDMNAPTETGPPSQRGLRLHLTADGQRESMFHFDIDELENRRIWNRLPGHMWALIGEAKPGATVFAHAFHVGEQLKLKDERANAAIVHHTYGTGQVMWLGIDSTWRWRHRRGDQFHHRFWGQLGRWAADNKAAAGNKFVRFRAERSEVQEDEEIVLQARFTREYLRRFPNVKATVEVFTPADKKPLTVLPLEPSPEKPLTWAGRLVSLKPGEYRAKLKLENGDAAMTELETSLFVHERQTLELSDLSANRELLRSLAETSSGQMLEPHEAKTIPDLLLGENQSSEISDPITLWDHWLVMSLFFVLMTAEWVIRKLNGLP